MIPLSAFYTVLLAALASAVIGPLAGAYIYHCARVSKNPVSLPGAETIKMLVGRKKPEEPKKPQPPRLGA